jgi:hypothetical protein
MPTPWPALPYDEWVATLDTLHGHTQVLGKLANALAPAQPELQHAALRLTARGWETAPLPAPDDSGAIGVALDLHRLQAVVEHTDGRFRSVALTPNRAVGDVTRDLLATFTELGGPVELDLKPSEVPWTARLDEDIEHQTLEPAHVQRYFEAATRAAEVLAAFRAPYRGRSTPLNAWWGGFDLAVSLFSGRHADPPRQDYISRNSMDAEEIAFGWWPGMPNYPRAAFYAYVYPKRDGVEDAPLTPAAARWDAKLGEFLLDWDDVVGSAAPFDDALGFALSVARHACTVCGWDPRLVESIDGVPPPVD